MGVGVGVGVGGGVGFVWWGWMVGWVCGGTLSVVILFGLCFRVQTPSLCK